MRVPELSRHHLLEQLFAYTSPYSGEGSFLPKFIDLLKHPDCFKRTHLPGHITGSAWILDEEEKHVLLVHHAKLNKWLQPGGHADGDEDVLRVALREAEEETGIRKFLVTENRIFDIDIHPIPARKDFPGHLHYDVRYRVQASIQEPLVVSEESHDVQWIALDQLEKYNNEPSLLRMRSKLL